MAELFVNLPVESLDRAAAFYLKLGFSLNFQLSGAEMTAMDYSGVHLLLHTAGSYLQVREQSASDYQHVGLSLSLQCDNRDQVESLFEQALQAGAETVGAVTDNALSYGRTFSDPDGHHWQLFWLDIAQD